jgi:hypothetical protein
MIDTIANSELSAGLDALRIAEENIREAQDAQDRIRGEIIEIGRRFLMEATPDQVLSRAALLYWSVPEVPVSMLASVVLGNPKAANLLAASLPKDKAPTFSCSECNSNIHASSRADVAHILSSRRKGTQPICKRCLDIRAEETRKQWNQERNWTSERIAALQSMPYREYLVTEEWLDTRNQKLRESRYRCQLCNSGGLLNVHHRTYERRGCEWMTDLIVLCHPCHAKFHDKVPA